MILASMSRSHKPIFTPMHNITSESHNTKEKMQRSFRLHDKDGNINVTKETAKGVHTAV